MRIILLEDRISTEGDLFLKAGYYPLIREIKDLGWIVQTNYDDRFPQYTLIRFEKGLYE